MTPADLANIGRALYGHGYRPSLARALAVSDGAVDRWLNGSRTMPPGLRADLVRLLRAKAAETAALADTVAAGIGDLHGMTRRETAFVGWLLSGEWFSDETWPDGYTAAALRARVRRELADDAGDRIRMDAGEAARLLAALGRLSDRQARDVLQAARDLDELCPDVPGD